MSVSQESSLPGLPPDHAPQQAAGEDADGSFAERTGLGSPGVSPTDPSAAKPAGQQVPTLSHFGVLIRDPAGAPLHFPDRSRAPPPWRVLAVDLWIDFLINRWHEATLMDYAHLIMAVILVGWGMTRARGW